MAILLICWRSLRLLAVATLTRAPALEISRLALGICLREQSSIFLLCRVSSGYYFTLLLSFLLSGLYCDLECSKIIECEIELTCQ